MRILAITLYLLLAGLTVSGESDAQYGPPGALPTTAASAYRVDPCQNPSTNDCWQKRCRADAYGGYTCEPCPSGYQDVSPDPSKPGRVCQPGVSHPCSDPKCDCDKNADCRETNESPEGYTCCCKSGYTDNSPDKQNKPGRNCEQTPRPCDTNRCPPGAECIDNGDNTFRCQCTDSYVDEYPNEPGRACKKRCQKPYVHIPGDGCICESCQHISADQQKSVAQFVDNGCGYPEYNTCGSDADCHNTGNNIRCVPRNQPSPYAPQPQVQPQPQPCPSASQCCAVQPRPSCCQAIVSCPAPQPEPVPVPVPQPQPCPAPSPVSCCQEPRPPCCPATVSCPAPAPQPPPCPPPAPSTCCQEPRPSCCPATVSCPAPVPQPAPTPAPQPAPCPGPTSCCQAPRPSCCQAVPTCPQPQPQPDTTSTSTVTTTTSTTTTTSPQSPCSKPGLMECGKKCCSHELFEKCCGDDCCCEDGKGRRDPSDPCDPTSECLFSFLVVKLDNGPLTFNNTFTNTDGAFYKHFVETFNRGIINEIKNTDYWNNFIKADIVNPLKNPTNVDPTCGDGVWVNFKITFLARRNRPCAEIYDGLVSKITNNNNYIDATTMVIEPLKADGDKYSCILKTTPTSTTEISKGSVKPVTDYPSGRNVTNCTDFCGARNINATCCPNGKDCCCPRGFIDISHSQNLATCGFPELVDVGFIHCIRTVDVDLCCLGLHDCRSGADCVPILYPDGTHDYKCVCKLGLKEVPHGAYCPSQDVGVCDKCSFHGKCVYSADNSTVVCQCDTWYVGATCATDVREILAIIFAILFLLLSLLCCLYYCLKCRCWRRRRMIYSHLSSTAASESGEKGMDFTIPRPIITPPLDTGLRRADLDEEAASVTGSSEASWESEYERRVTTDSRRVETTRTVGGGVEETATTAQFRVYAPEAEERYRESSHETRERSVRETTEESSGGQQYAYTSGGDAGYSYGGAGYTTAAGAAGYSGAVGAAGGSLREPRSISAYSGSDTEYDSVASSDNAEATYDKRTLVKKSREYEPEATGRGGTVRYGQEVTTKVHSKEHRDL